MIICIVLCLGLILGPVTAAARRRATGALVVGGYVLAVLILFWYFYPILTGQAISYTDWSDHMWYRGLFSAARGWV
jgi:dolichyl-phosphate-mannose--protein O-mannosyl transferase